MNRLRQLVREIHRRSLWQVLLIYVGASWAALQVVDTVAGALQLPDWLEPVALVLLIVGLPIVLATAFVQEGGPRGEPTSAAASPAPQDAAARSLFTWRNAFGGGVLAFALWGVVAAGWVMFGGAARGAAPEATGEAERSVAVLPFVNMSGSSDNEYFSDGITEELLNALAQVPGLRVPGRTSSFALKGKELTVQQIADTLNVAHVLEGSVRREGGRVRITAQLLDARSDTHLWSETFERDLEDIFAIQREIATAIAGELQVTLSGDQEESIVVERTRDPEAYDLYLRGWAAYSGRTALPDVDAAIGFYERAVAVDPEFALAYAGAAQAWYNRPNYGGNGPRDRARAEEMALTAVSLDPTLAAANLVLANLARTRWEWDEAERLYRLTIDSQPNDPEAHHEYGEFLLVVGRCSESVTRQRRAMELDPFSAIFPGYLGAALWCEGRREEGIDYGMQALERGSPFVAPAIPFQLLEIGRVNDAIDFARDHDLPWHLAVAEAVRDGTGPSAVIESEAPSGFIGMWGLAIVGDRAGVSRLLSARLAERTGNPVPVWSQAFWDVVEGDPRLQELMEEIGFHAVRPAV
jgi:adenylate cyclase